MGEWFDQSLDEYLLSTVKGLFERAANTTAAEVYSHRIRLSLGHLSGAFVLLLIGLVASFVVFIGENIMFYYVRKEKQKQAKIKASHIDIQLVVIDIVDEKPDDLSFAADEVPQK